MDDKDRFREVALSVGMGPRFEIEKAPLVESKTPYGIIRSNANELIASARHSLPKLPKVHFDFILQGQPNAYATKYQGEYFIAISTGVVFFASLLFSRILAHRKTFPDVGKPQSELQELPLIPWNTIDAEELFVSGVTPLNPVDSKRQSYSQHLLKQFSMFIMGHELAHITRGHVDYLQTKRGNHFIAELGWDGLSEESKLERQALEFDADRRTVLARAYSMFSTVDDENKVVQPWSQSGKLVSIESLQFDWAFSANVMYRLFGDSVFTKKELNHSTHPPMPLRRRMAMNYAKHLLLDNWTREGGVVDKTIDNSIRMTENAFLAIGAPAPDGGFFEAHSADSNAHLIKVMQTTESLMPDLSKYSYEKMKSDK